MNSRWTDKDAGHAIAQWGEAASEAFALRLYTARLLGADPDLVLHGGGNVSMKGRDRTILGDEIDVLYVKASGCDLAALEPLDLPALELAPLCRLRALEALTDDDMVNELRSRRLSATAPTPSIETLVHAFIPHRFIDHTHADAVLALTNQPNGDALIRKVLGDRVAILPYVRPGFELAKAATEALESHPDVEGLVLLHHGLVTFGDDARTAYERHVALVDACEQFVVRRMVATAPAAAQPQQPGPVEPAMEPGALAARVAPVLRGLLAERTGDEDRPYRRPILAWRMNAGVAALLSDSATLKAFTSTGPLTGDHLIRTKTCPLLVPEPAWDDGDKLRQQLEAGLTDFRDGYRTYIETHGGHADGVDLAPRVVVLPGAGFFCWGGSKREAEVVGDIAEHTLSTKAKASAVGTYVALCDEHLYDMEFREQQQAKVKATSDRPLGGQVVAISGGAGAIGTGVAEACATAGASVVIADIAQDRITAVVEGIDKRHGAGTALGLKMDVTDEQSVAEGFAEIVRVYGGVDVLVPNAGIAHVSSIEHLEVTDFRRVMEINTVGYLLFMREGIKIMKRQGLGGHIIINASKNVFAPGRDFGAYSASKAAGHQLGKVAALELAPFGIRVNMINADAVFGDKDAPSGLWEHVGPRRAKSRNLNPQDLPEYYRNRNLLKVRVCGRHVGNAVVFFATNQTPTTGATLPVDGGLADAFPR